MPTNMSGVLGHDVDNASVTSPRPLPPSPVANELTIEVWVAQTLNLYVPPFLIVLGSAVNLLGVVALRRGGHSRRHSVCFYLAVLAVTNLLALYLGCGLEWVSTVSRQPHVATLQDWICKVWDFSRKMAESASAWLIVAMAIDRFLVMWFPVNAKSMCTVFVAKFTNGIIFVGLTSIHIHSMWTFEVSTYQDRPTCSVNSTQRDFETQAWPYIAASFSYYLPTLAVAVFSSLAVCGSMCLGKREALPPLQRKLVLVTLAQACAFLLWSVPSLAHILMPYFVPAGWLFHTDPPVRFLRWRLAYTIIQLVKYLYFACGAALYFCFLPELQKALSRHPPPIQIQELQRAPPPRGKAPQHPIPSASAAEGATYV